MNGLKFVCWLVGCLALGVLSLWLAGTRVEHALHDYALPAFVSFVAAILTALWSEIARRNVGKYTNCGVSAVLCLIAAGLFLTGHGRIEGESADMIFVRWLSAGVMMGTFFLDITSMLRHYWVNRKQPVHA